MLNFLSLSKEIFGLEITDTNVRIMKLTRRRGWLRAVMAGCAVLESGIVESGQIKNEEKLAAKIKTLVARLAGDKKQTRYAVISLPEDHAFFQVINMPRLNPEELRAAVVFEAENYIPLPLEKVYLDFEILPSVFSDQDRCEAAVAAAGRELVDSRARVADSAGLMPIALELESQATVRAALEGRILKSPTMIIQIGDGYSSVIIYSRDSIRFVFSIPISNSYFLKTITDAVKVDLEEAESLKTECGIEEFASFFDGERKFSSGSKKGKIFEALIPGLIDFSQQIQRCIRYYQNHEEGANFEKTGFNKIFICGSGSNLKGLQDFLALKLNSPVERMVLAIGVDAADFKNVGFAENNVFGCAVVVGLAIRALRIQSGDDKKPILLEPPIPKFKIGKKKKAPRASAAAV